MSPELKNLLNAPRNEWRTLVEKQCTQLLAINLPVEIDHLIQHLALLSAYVEERYYTGCGEQSHEDACKAANKQLKKVRAALGYSYPDKFCPLR